MSGGWQRTFNLSAPTEVTLSFRYKLAQSSEYESDEYSQALVSVDGTLYGSGANDYVAQITGNGNGGSDETTGWQLFEVNVGTLSAGDHTLTLGGYNNKKTYNDETTEILVDDVLVVGGEPGPTPTPTDTPTPTPTGEPPTPTPTQEPGVVFSDDFEADKGWTVNPAGTNTATTGMWERANPEGTEYSGVTYQLDTTASGSYDLVTGPLAGSSVGSYDIDGGLTSIRSPDVALPTGQSLTLSFKYYLSHYSNATNDDFLRVKVVGSTTTTVFEELGSGDYDEAVWADFGYNLDAFAGQTVYLLIEAADGGSGSLVEAAIDDVLIE